MLVRLLYTSRAAATCNESLVRSIRAQSLRNNALKGITGILCVDLQGGVFLQALEGGRSEVSDLYATICQDPRHADITLLDFSEIEERRFASWRMGIVALENVNVGRILRYSETAQLDPHSMTARNALAVLEELSDSASMVGSDAS